VPVVPVVPGVVLPGAVVVPGVVVPAPDAGGVVFAPGALLAHGAISAACDEADGVVLFVLAPVVPRFVVAPAPAVVEPAPPRAEADPVTEPLPLVAPALAAVEPAVVVDDPAFADVEPEPVTVPVVPTVLPAVDDPLRAVVAPASVRVLPVAVALPLRREASAVAPVLVVDVAASAEFVAGTHGNALAFGPVVPDWLEPDRVVPGVVVPVASGVPAVPGVDTPDVLPCPAAVEGLVVLCAWSGTISAAVSSAPPADNANLRFTWTFLSTVTCDRSGWTEVQGACPCR
jgi:hypothetical protein